jgi:hypothetical protein
MVADTDSKYTIGFSNEFALQSKLDSRVRRLSIDDIECLIPFLKFIHCH